MTTLKYLENLYGYLPEIGDILTLIIQVQEAPDTNDPRWASKHRLILGNSVTHDR